MVSAPVKDWLQGLEHQRRYSPRTLKAYADDLRAFCAQMGAADDLDFQSLTEADVRSWMAAQHRKGLSPATLQRRLSALRSFCDYLLEQKLISHNPASGVRGPKQRRPLPKALDVDPLFRLLDSIPRDEPLALRDRAILELFYSSGLRLAELQSLDEKALRAALGQQPRQMIVRGKGNKERMIAIGDTAAVALQDWLKARPELADVQEPAVFVSRRGGRLSARAIEARLEHWARKLGLGQGLHPHMLRHSFASHLLQSGADLRGVQELLGHANLSTTQVYTRLDFQRLSQVYDAAHPRARRKA